MSVLVMRLAGPLQSWGASARFARRTTEPAPTKSGVLGLLAAAQGRDRTADLTDLAALRFGVRADQPGVRVRDYQTAQHFDTAKSMPLSERFYLADAVFLAVVEGDETLIDDLDHALRSPVYLPYLGRRSCPPSGPIDLGVRRDWTLEDALGRAEWQAARWHQRRRRKESDIRLVTSLEPRPELEPRPDEKPDDSLRDQPLTFDPGHRRYALRPVRTGQVTIPNPQARRDGPPAHDPTLLLEEA